MKSLVIAAITVLSCSAIGASAGQTTPQGPAASESYAQACGLYAVFQCARTRGGISGPGRVVDTSRFPNFRPGWYCRVMGPFDHRGEATSAARRGGGYVKEAC